MPNDRITELIAAEADRQARQLSLIASENYASKAVMDACGSVLTNKYAEGYPGKRYYGGNEVIDQIESYAIEMAQQLFDTDYHVNVQPESGSPANLGVYNGLLEPGDTVLAMSLAHGGHLTHGHSVSLTGKIYNFVHYGVAQDTELIDFDQVRELARTHKPKLIVAGSTAYPMTIDFRQFEEIAKEVGALLMVDMAHIAGLVAGKAHPSPFGIADVITSSTHKSLRGPRGGIIFCRPDLAKAVDRGIFPGLQGGPHMHTIAAKAVAFHEALQPSFVAYAKQVVANAKALAFALQQHGIRLVADGTETHLILADLRSTKLLGKEAQEVLNSAGVIANKNMIPYDPNTAVNPSGLRLGTPAITTRGAKEKDMEQLAAVIARILTEGMATDTDKEEVAQMAKRLRIPAYF